MSGPAQPVDGGGTGVTGREGVLAAGVAAGGELRWAAVDLTGPVEEVRWRLDLGPLATAAVGRAMAGAAMLLRLSLKVPARLGVELSGDGPLGRVLAQADADGSLRGTVGNALAALPSTPEGKLAVGAGVGRGRMRVTREERSGAAYHSQVDLVSGEIGEDLAHFLAQSEQVPSAVLVGVLARPSGVAAAGGILVQAMPGADDATLSLLEANVGAVGGVSRAIEERGLETTAERILDGLDGEVRDRHELRYRCGCSRARLARHLAALSGEELAGLESEAGQVEAECLFCGASYRYEAGELASLADDGEEEGR